MMKIDSVNSAIDSPFAGLFFISINKYVWAENDWDEYIAEYLGLNLKQYQNILIKYGAKLFPIESVPDNNGECYFEHKSDAEKTLVELEPYYIMTELNK